MSTLHLILTQDITIAELTMILSEVASYVSEDAKIKGLTTLRISLDELQYLTESPSEQEHIIQEMLDTLGKYHVQEGVKTYSVGIHIETPLRDEAYFLPSNKRLRSLLEYEGIDSDTKDQEWQTYMWSGTFTAEQLVELLDEYAMEDHETSINQFTFPGGDRLVECLDFHGGYPSPFLNEVTIYANPELEGLDEETLARVAPLYQREVIG